MSEEPGPGEADHGRMRTAISTATSDGTASIELGAAASTFALGGGSCSSLTIPSVRFPRETQPRKIGATFRT